MSRWDTYPDDDLLNVLRQEAYDPYYDCQPQNDCPNAAQCKSAHLCDTNSKEKPCDFVCSSCGYPSNGPRRVLGDRTICFECVEEHPSGCMKAHYPEYYEAHAQVLTELHKMTSFMSMSLYRLIDLGNFTPTGKEGLMDNVQRLSHELHDAISRLSHNPRMD